MKFQDIATTQNSANGCRNLRRGVPEGRNREDPGGGNRNAAFHKTLHKPHSIREKLNQSILAKYRRNVRNTLTLKGTTLAYHCMTYVIGLCGRFRVSDMLAPKFRFRTHVFTFSAADLELHENLMPCVIFGKTGPVDIGNEQYRVCADIVGIKPNEPHRVSIPEGGAEIVYFDGLIFPESSCPFFEVDRQWVDLPPAIKNGDLDAINKFRDHIAKQSPPADPAILAIVASLYTSSIDRLSQAQLSDRLGLERTQALRHFKANTGQTFRKFKIWASSVSAVHDVFGGKNIGTAGIDSGFSDAAHVARTARTIFGLTPTAGIQHLIDVTSV